MTQLTGSVAIVTGGAQGIGRGIVVQLLEEGWQVVVADVDREAGEEIMEALAPASRVTYVEVDTSDEAAVASMVGTTIERFGRIDGLVNNAGIADPGAQPVENLALDAWLRVISVNLTGYFLCAKHCIPHLRASKGAIVNISSTRSLQSEPHTEAYSASKGGVDALTHALAISLGPDVRVNAINPGWIVVDDWKKSRARREPNLRAVDHAQHPVGRTGTPADIAHLVSYLLSDRAAFVTGQRFVVDGGMTRKMVYVD